MVTIKNPDAPATAKQLYRLHELTGRDTRDWDLTKQKASNAIENLELKELARNTDLIIPDDASPHTEAHVKIITGAQRGGKTGTAVGFIKDSYDKDCVRIYCEKIFHVKCEVKAYYRKDRVAKIKHEGKVKYIEIPKEYKLHSPMRIFSNIHLFGMPYVYIPTFRHLIKWLKIGFIKKGWVLVDEAHLGINARAGMTQLGQELEKQSFQFGKMELDVIIITHMTRLIDWAIRTIPTEKLDCIYNPKNHKVTYAIKKKGQSGEREVTYDATQYWGNYWTNEKVNA